MTNRTTAPPRMGANVRFGIPDTRLCSNRTTIRTPSEREPDNEPDTSQTDTLHAQKPDTSQTDTLHANERNMSGHNRPAIRLRWTAARDGIAHARARPPAGRGTACGVRPIEERYAWPTLARCPACVAVLADARQAESLA